ncbi:MAG: adenylate kinase family protein [Minisyncoccia bacterium]|jgi:adenylate kinase
MPSKKTLLGKNNLSIIFLGRSGAGKGTQLALLKNKLNLYEIDSGSLLRNFVKQKNPLALNINKIISDGKLVPTWLVVYLWLKTLLNIKSEKGVIFEGSPRRLEEAKILEESLNIMQRKFIVIYLNVSEKEVIRRLLLRRICVKCGREYSLEFNPNLTHCPKCGGKLVKRSDDNLKAIKHRLEYFRKDIIPVINYFRKKKLLIEINGEGSIKEVHERIIKSLNKYLKIK